MKILFLNLASHSSVPEEGACIACVSETKTEAIHFIDHRIGDSGVVPVIEEVLKDAKWDHKDLTHIASVTGPGGFTSLRMGVSLANVYGDQLGVGVAGVHLSDLYGFRVTSFEKLLWVHSTKKTHLFVRVFGVDRDPWSEPILVSLEELQARIGEFSSWCGELIPDHRIIVKDLAETPLRPAPEVLPAFLSKLSYTEGILAPWYGRGW